MGAETAIALALMGGSMGGSVLTSMFAPEGQKIKSFEGGDTIDPRWTTKHVQDMLRDLYPIMFNRAQAGVNVRGSEVQDLPVFSGGGLPMPIGVSGRDYALDHPDLLFRGGPGGGTTERTPSPPRGPTPGPGEVPTYPNPNPPRPPGPTTPPGPPQPPPNPIPPEPTGCTWPPPTCGPGMLAHCVNGAWVCRPDTPIPPTPPPPTPPPGGGGGPGPGPEPPEPMPIGGKGLGAIGGTDLMSGFAMGRSDAGGQGGQGGLGNLMAAFTSGGMGAPTQAGDAEQARGAIDLLLQSFQMPGEEPGTGAGPVRSSSPRLSRQPRRRNMGVRASA